eukprot:1361410-Rhodomonas_salina.1
MESTVTITYSARSTSGCTPPRTPQASTPSPVPPYATATLLRTGYAEPGTELAYRATWRSAVSYTEVAYRAMRR